MGKIVKSNVRSTQPVKGERSDKNQYEVSSTGSNPPRGTHQIHPAKVNTTAPKDL